jgi:hypothetical protein
VVLDHTAVCPRGLDAPLMSLGGRVKAVSDFGRSGIGAGSRSAAPYPAPAAFRDDRYAKASVARRVCDRLKGAVRDQEAGNLSCDRPLSRFGRDVQNDLVQAAPHSLAGLTHEALETTGREFGSRPSHREVVDRALEPRLFSLV